MSKKFEYPQEIIDIAKENKLTPRELVKRIYNKIPSTETCYRNITPDYLTHLECLTIIEFLREKDCINFNGRYVNRQLEE